MKKKKKRKKEYIAIVDYGMGNLHSVIKGIQKVKVPVKLTKKPAEIKSAAGIIIPGVGAFGDAVRELKTRKLFDVIRSEVKKGKPVLGICLGMQLLFTASSEFGKKKGFGFIKGRVIRFKKGMKVPHMGWNRVESTGRHPLLKGIKDKGFYYFVHSYYAVPSSKKAVLTKTRYGNTIFTSGTAFNNIFGFQFHPEKSGESSLKIYKNFYNICNKA